MQRVSSASVAIDGETVGAIGRGLVVLLGVRRGDDGAGADRIVRKLLALRVFEDEEGRMNISAGEAGAEFLCVSNFTLYGDVPVAAVDERMIDRLLGLVVEGAIAVRSYAAAASSAS